jgi:hypothetical protein
MLEFKKWLITEMRVYIQVYHVSPVSGLYRIRPQHSRHGEGIFVAPKFSDAVAWFVSYVKWKKGKTQKDKRNERLKEKGKGFHDPELHYQFGTIYRLRVPKDILDNAWSSNWWESEYFLPESALKNITIEWQKTYTNKEFVAMYERQKNVKYNVRSYNPEKIAKELRSNVAAQMYLNLLEKFRSLLLQGKQLEKDQIKELFRKLQSHFFRDYYSYDGPKKFLQADNPQEVDRIVKQILEKLEAKR